MADLYKRITSKTCFFKHPTHPDYRSCLLALKVVFNASEKQGKEKHKPVPLYRFIHHGEKPLKMGCVFPRLFYIQNNSPVCTGKFHSMW